MPLFEIAADGLVPFRQLRGGSELYESRIEELLWENLVDLTGEPLFKIRRQPQIAGGGRPDIVAIDATGAVVVIEVKRDVDRSQLAQCLEYAGWARTTSLDELAGLYWSGAGRFWADWQEFTGTTEPRRVSKSPRLILVARDFDARTDSALDFLRENGLPITLIRLSLYEDSDGRSFLDLEGIEEPEPVHEPSTSGAPAVVSKRLVNQVSLADLLGAGLLSPGEELRWERPRVGQSLVCTVTEDARLVLPDGRTFTFPSGAATAAAGGGNFDGWEAWRAQDHANTLLHELRKRFQSMQNE